MINQPAPGLEVAFFDAGSQLDLASLEIVLDDLDLTATCTVCSARATCPSPTLAEGPHLFSASLRDTTGNLATASFAFDLLLGDGEHRLTLPVLADTYLRDGSPNQNQGTEDLLRIRSSGKNRALVRFDLGGVAELVDTLESATLELFIANNGNNWGTNGRTVDVHALGAEWSEPGATWNCAADANPVNSQPDCSPLWNGGNFDTEPTDTITITNGLSGWVQLDVTADVLGALAGDPHHGWLLKKTFENQNGLVEFSSKEGAPGQAPRLVLTFEGGEPPDTEPPAPVDPQAVQVSAPIEGAVVV
ncbi:MAG: DNRLRE domain-containing protein, partial [Thermoanaerobaculia bacterium]|nr:DNRLRE domain-containing protein [Thermoanaerobaculia bacterium]